MAETRINPFIGYGKVVTGERFVGRQQPHSELLGFLLGDVGSFNLVGAPRIGKSSLINAIISDLRVKRPEFLVIKVSLLECPDPVRFYNRIANEFLAELLRLQLPRCEPANGGEDLDAQSAFETFRRLIQTVVGHSSSMRVILVIDEFDRVRHWPGGDEVVRQLRSLSNDTPKYRLSCAMVSRRRLKQIEMALTGVSVFADSCHLEFLRPLDADGLNAMLMRFDPEFSATDLDLIYQQSGGNPFLAEMVLYLSWPCRSIIDGLNLAAAGTVDYYSTLRNFLEDGNLLLPLLRLAVKPRLTVPDFNILSILNHYGLVRHVSKDEDGHSGYRAFSENFQVVLERMHRIADFAGDTWTQWRHTETSLRDFIDGALREDLGKDWEEQLSSKYPAVRQRLEKCRETAEREMKTLGHHSTGRLLDYTYPDDLLVILQMEWNRFEKRMRNVTPDSLKAKFARMAKVRASFAQNREVPGPIEHEAKQAYAEVSDIIRMANDGGGRSGGGTWQPLSADDIRCMASSGERGTIEYKRSFLKPSPEELQTKNDRIFNLATREKAIKELEDEIKNEVLNAVLEFMNHEGGHILLGVEPSGEIIGLNLEYELRHFKRDPKEDLRDPFQRLILQDLENHVEPTAQSFVGSMVRFPFLDDIDGKFVCCLRVEPVSADRVVFDKKGYLLVRLGGPKGKCLVGSAADDYRKERQARHARLRLP